MLLAWWRIRPLTRWHSTFSVSERVSQKNRQTFGRSTIRNAPLARLRIVSSKVLGGTFCETAVARLFFPARPRPNAPGKVRRKIVRFRRETYRWSHIGVRLRRGERPGRFRRSNTPGYQKVYISMKLSLFTGLAAVAAAAFFTAGCASTPEASSQTGGVQKEFQKWAEKRTDVEQVVSKSSDPQVKAIIDGIAVIPGGVYGYLAEGADEAMARNLGRGIYEAIARDMEAGTPKAEIRKAVSDADWAAAVDYAKYVKSQDYATLGEELSGIAAKLAADGAKVAGAIVQIKNLDAMKGKNPIALASAMKEPAAEINVIKGQLADAVEACKYWQGLNKQDEQQQKHMQEYPIE